LTAKPPSLTLPLLIFYHILFSPECFANAVAIDFVLHLHKSSPYNSFNFELMEGNVIKVQKITPCDTLFPHFAVDAPRPRS